MMVRNVQILSMFQSYSGQDFLVLLMRVKNAVG